MLLYHGTSENAALQALRYGLRPRKQTGTANWGDLLSNPECVYLTDTYACHYALNARLNGVRIPGPEGKIRNRIAVIEIDTDRLPFSNFMADEDFLAVREAYATNNPSNENLRGLISNHSKKLTRNWKESLKFLGTCAYRETISPRHFTRVAYFDHKQNRDMAAAMADGIISPQAYKFAGAYHRAYTRWLFGGPVTALEILGLEGLSLENLSFEKDRVDYWENNILNNREGIEVINLKENKCKK